MPCEQRLQEKKEWQESNPVLNEFCWEISRTMADVARTDDDRSLITDIPAGEQYIVETPKENRIYNVGLETGMVALVDHLRYNGYTIISPMSGHPVPFEDLATLVDSNNCTMKYTAGKTFCETYYDYNWGVNT